MDPILSDTQISISEFKKNLAAVLREAKNRPVAVLNRNRPAFYMLEPKLFEAILEELSDTELRQSVLARLSERANAIEVDIDTV